MIDLSPIYPVLATFSFDKAQAKPYYFQNRGISMRDADHTGVGKFQNVHSAIHMQSPEPIDYRLGTRMARGVIYHTVGFQLQNFQ